MLLKKGQITIFVIFGILLFLILLILFSLQQTTLQTQQEAQAKTQLQEFSQLKPVQDYVGSCLDAVTTQGVRLLTTQGGVIWEDQGGRIAKNVTSLNYLPHHYFITQQRPGGTSYLLRTHNISYALSLPVPCQQAQPALPVDIALPYTSYYPVKETFFEDYFSRYMSYGSSGCFAIPSQSNFNPLRVRSSGFLAANNFPKLCYHNGSNAFETQMNYGGSLPLACTFDNFDTASYEYSLQKQLEDYVQKNLPRCANLTQLSNELGIDVGVNESAVTVQTLLQHPQGLLVQAQYPLFTQSSTGKLVGEQASFTAEFSFDLSAIHVFLSDLLVHMARDPNFSLQEDYMSLSTYQPSFEVLYETVSQAALSTQHAQQLQDHVLTIVDSSSQLRGEPLRISVGIEQRKPVLDYLHMKGTSTTINGKKIDYLFYTNSTARIDVKAMDPDGDDYNISYLGWRETNYTIFDWDCCQKNPDCNLSNHSMCMTTIDDSLHNWTNSLLYKQTNESASFRLNQTDAGVHKVIVVVEDEHGLQDFQIVDILVFDIPIAKLNTSNYFDDIDDSYASIEDPYLLNGSASQASSLLTNGAITNFSFSDETESFTVQAPFSQLVLPNESFTLYTLPQGYFAKTFFNDNDGYLQAHDLQLIISQEVGSTVVNSAPAVKTTYVSQCLAHQYQEKDESSSHLEHFDLSNYLLDSSEGYYYGSLPDNNSPITLPHVCCKPLEDEKNSEGQWTGGVIAADETCFQTDFMTCKPQDPNNGAFLPYLQGALFDGGEGELLNSSKAWEKELANLQSSYGLFMEDGSIIDDDADLANDVFLMDYSQVCGERGNICSGDIELDIEQISCSDFNQQETQFARCQGPGYQIEDGTWHPLQKNNCQGEAFDQLGCYNYSSTQTFEKKYLGDSKSIFCASHKPYTIDSENEFTPLNDNEESPYSYSCQATCNGEGSCEYWQLEHCTCDASSNVCRAYTAADFFTRQDDGSLLAEHFVCNTDEKLACGPSCVAQSNPDTQLEACYCKAVDYQQNGSYNLPQGRGAPQGIPFFNDSLYQVDISGDDYPSRCCTPDYKGSIYIDNYQEPQAIAVCANGEIIEHDAISKQGAQEGCFLNDEGSLFVCRTQHCVIDHDFDDLARYSMVNGESQGSWTCTASGWEKS